MPDVLTGDERELIEGSDVPMQQPKAEEKKPAAKTEGEYILLARQTDDSLGWTEMGNTKAAGPDEAIQKLADENTSIAEGIRQERVEIVAIAKRFWNVRKPRYTKPELQF